MSSKRLFLFSAFLGAAIVANAGSAAMAQGTVTLSDSQLVQVSNGLCGYVGNTWVPVRAKKTAGTYVTVQSVVARLKNRVARAADDKKAAARKRFRAAKASFTTVSALCTSVLNPDGKPIDPVTIPRGDVIRINCGGTVPYIDSSGAIWEPDTGLSAGSKGIFVTKEKIPGSTSAPLFQTERNGEYFTYNLPVENASYKVKIHLNEIWWTQAGQRLMSVAAEGQPIATGIDIFAAVGRLAPYAVEGTTVVTDSTLTLEFAGQLERAKCSAIEIEKMA